MAEPYLYGSTPQKASEIDFSDPKAMQRLMAMAMYAQILAQQPGALQAIQRIAALNNMVPNQLNPAIANAEAAGYQQKQLAEELGFTPGDIATYKPNENPLAVKYIQDQEEAYKRLQEYARTEWNKSSHPGLHTSLEPEWLKGNRNRPTYQNLYELQGMMNANGIAPINNPAFPDFPQRATESNTELRYE